MSPVYPGWFHVASLADHLRKGENEQALDEARKFNLPGWFWDPLVRAATLGHTGRIKQAQAAYRELLAINPDFEKNALYYVNAVFMDDTVIKRLFEGLYNAGLPEIKSP